MHVFDIIGPVMIGPSSSHTAGAVRLGNVAHAMLKSRRCAGSSPCAGRLPKPAAATAPTGRSRRALWVCGPTTPASATVCAWRRNRALLFRSAGKSGTVCTRIRPFCR